MAKDPAFLFYSSDFLVGTYFMSLEERGQYITVLCLLHQHGGSIPQPKLEEAVGKLHLKVVEKLQKNKHGLYNKRLFEEATKREEYSKSRRNNRLGKRSKKTYVPHMENENENENVNEDDKIIGVENWEKELRKALVDKEKEMRKR